MKQFILLIIFMLSCTTFKKPIQRRGQRQDTGTLEKKYNLKRETPLSKKYPDYQPLNSHRKRRFRRVRRRPTKLVNKFLLITPFTDRTDKYYGDLSLTSSNILAEKFKNSKHIILEDPKKLYAFINDSKPGVNGNDDLAISKLISQNTRLSSLITGTINSVDISTQGNNIGLFKETKYDCSIDISIRAIDSNLNKIIFEENITGNTNKSVSHFFSIEGKKDYKESIIIEALEDAFNKILWRLTPRIEKIGWKGKIADIDRNKIYITGGLKTGISMGDVLIVSNLGKVIFNPETKAPIGRAPGIIKGTIRIVDFFGEDGSIAVINSGANFQIDDFVELQ